MRPHCNRGLFSNYYLDELLPKEEEFKIPISEVKVVFEKVKGIWDRSRFEAINEDQLRKHFLDKILDYLGWIVDVEAPVLAGGWPKSPDYALFLNDESLKSAEKGKKEDYFRKAICVGEAKRWGRPLDKKLKTEKDPKEVQNPSLQISQYLWLTGVKWGILTDGKYWRLYERETSKRLDIFYEIDLENLIESGSPEDFRYFYLLFRKDAFPEFIEKVYKGSVDYAEEVGEQLKENIYQALKTLAQGFLKTSGNNLSEENLKEIHDNSLILLYRLLFILYAEHRDLLPLGFNNLYTESYSLDAFKKEVASRFDKNEPIATSTIGYWNKLKELFEIINIGNKELGVPPYNGGLFDPEKHDFLEKYRVGDLYVAKAIDLLSRSKDKAYIDYGSLGIRHLGSIYEGLLEYKLKIADQDLIPIKDKGKEIFVSLPEAESKKKSIREEEKIQAGAIYLVTDKGERKATGSYYTPGYIVNYIIENTLGPLVEEKRKKVSENIEEIKEKIKWSRGTNREFHEKELTKVEGSVIDEVLSLKVLDPAMGSGHFLVEATDFLARKLLEVLSGEPLDEHPKEFMVKEASEHYGLKELEEEDIRWARREVVERCIFGVDSNPMAVELAKLSLWLYTVAKGKPLNFLDHHLKFGNSLIGAELRDINLLPKRMVSKERKTGAQIQLPLELSHISVDLGLAVGGYKVIESKPTDKISDVKDKGKIYKSLDKEKIDKWRLIANIWTSAFFGLELDQRIYQALSDFVLARVGKTANTWVKDYFDRAVNIASEKHFFHWELEFPEVFYDHHGKALSNPGFDTVIGNPPYLNVEQILSDDRDFLMNSGRYSSTIKRIDIFIPFHEQSIKLLSNGGRHSFIVPFPLLTQDYGQRLRLFFLDNTVIENIVDLSKWKVFPDATVRNIIPVFTKKGPETDYKIEVITQEEDPNKIQKVTGTVKLIEASQFRDTYENMFRIDSSVELHRIQKKINGVSIKLGKIFAASWGARGVPAEKFHLDSPINNFCKKMVKGANIDRYKIEYSGKYLLYDPQKLYRPSMPVFFENDKIIFQEVTGKHSLIGSYDTDGFYTDHSLICCIPKHCFDKFSEKALKKHKVYASKDDKELSEKYNPLYILAVMNSKVNGFYFSNFVGYDLNVYPENIEYLPIRYIYLSTSKADRERLVTESKNHYKKYLETSKPDAFLYFIGSRLMKEHKPVKELVRKHNSDSLNRDWQIPEGALWEQSDVAHDILTFLAEQMIEMNKAKQKEIKGFLEWLESQLRIQSDIEGNIGIEVLTGKTQMKNYLGDYQKGEDLLPFEEFWKVLEKNRSGIQANLKSRELYENIKSEYEKSLSKLLPLKEKLRKTDWLIDQIVYRLYGLTEEEVKIVEGKG